MDSDSHVRFGLACALALCSLATAAADGLPEAGESLLCADLPNTRGTDPTAEFIYAKYEHDLDRGTTNLRIALIHTRGDDTFKLLYGTSFRAPSAFEMYYTDNGYSQKINPDFKPETILTYELVRERALKSGVHGLATWYHYQIDRLITFGIDPNDQLYVYENTGSVAATGLEFELEGHLSAALEGRISYACQLGAEGRTNHELSNSPPQLIKLNLSTPLLREHVLAGVETQYTSRRWIPYLDISAGICNLFDTAYADPAADIYTQNTIPQDGRIYRSKAKYEL